MRKYIFILSMLAGLPFISWSQVKRCGTTEYMQQEIKNNPSYQVNLDKIEVQTKKYIEQKNAAENNRKGGGGTTASVIIPVVFHVVYNTAAQNVPDKQIMDQLAVLNKDYSATNSDVTKVPRVFSSTVGDFGIQFCLATVDPNGNATNGIVRTQSSITSFGTNDAVKSSKRGGDEAWPRDKYLNIWVCNLGGNLLGYATFPGGSAQKDGVVILYSSLPGGSAEPYDKGRTATHEVGHWLNLRHIWGDRNCGDDYVDDTPTQRTANFGCPAFPHVTCNNGPNGDMFMNYMDYTDDGCMFMFTKGQGNRSDALFASGGARVVILSSNGCSSITKVTQNQSSFVISANESSARLNNDLRVYPSPVRSFLTVELVNYSGGLQTVRFFNLMGQQVLQTSISQSSAKINVANLPRGIYLIKVGAGKEEKLQQFIKE
ncbi:MAG: M43 family zinc metalloprotease [Sphingobacteriales bacterium]